MEKIKKYQKKPVIIEAIQFQDDAETITAISEFMQKGFSVDYSDDKDNPTLKISTLEGIMTANVGDYIIKDVKGEFYTCKPDIFEETYNEI